MFCFLQATPMANRDLQVSKPCWARQLQAFSISKHCGHLFAPVSLKEPLFYKFLHNQVRFRPSSFSNPCYMSNRSLHAEHYELWIHENDWVLSEISGNEVCCSLLSLLDSCYSMCFNAIGRWICNVWSLFGRFEWLISCSGRVNFFILEWWRWTCCFKTLDFARFSLEFMFGLLLSDVAWW